MARKIWMLGVWTVWFICLYVVCRDYGLKALGLYGLGSVMYACFTLLLSERARFRGKGRSRETK